MATKGMWVVVDGLTVVADQGEDGGTVVVECANDEDDAKLFAAAPKMLAALTAAYRFEGARIAAFDEEFWPDWFVAAKEAIAEATVEEQP